MRGAEPSESSDRMWGFGTLRVEGGGGVCEVDGEKRVVPAQVIWAVIGKDAELPCDLTPDPGDRVNMVLWFKDLSGIPLYSSTAEDGEIEVRISVG
uniref:Uncharacterized protein n=1 Tax=Timema douglasi TaxID=61478 RepID=A0A7R8VB34_TIMDO|nr:unnamed protein product [Timema douglasi]